MAFGQMGWGQPMYGGGYMPQMQQMPNMGAMPDQLAQLRAQQMTQQIPQTQAAQGGLIWVQGEAGAKSYLVAPGQHVQLMDSEAEVFYIKSTDPSGVPLPLRIFDYKERTTGAVRPVQAAQQPMEEYVTRSEYDALASKLADVMDKLNAMSASVQTSRADIPARDAAPRRGLREEREIDA